MTTATSNPWPRTGHAEMDRQHERLHALLAIVCARVGSGLRVVDVAALRPAITAFIDATMDHIAFENGLMMRTGFPEAGKHMADHQLIADQIAQLAASLDAGTSLVWPLELTLSRWQEHHSGGLDLALAEHAAGAEPAAG